MVSSPKPSSLLDLYQQNQQRSTIRNEQVNVCSNLCGPTLCPRQKQDKIACINYGDTFI